VDLTTKHDPGRAERAFRERTQLDGELVALDESGPNGPSHGRLTHHGRAGRREVALPALELQSAPR